MNSHSADELDRAIRQHRSTNATVTLLHDGTPLAGQEIVLAQKTHRFLIGANWGHRGNPPAEEVQDNTALANAREILKGDRSTIALANGELSGQAKAEAELQHERFIALCNQVTLPFYWAGYEPVRGKPDSERLLNAARWFKDQGCVVKGHPLCWHTLSADWLLPMSNAKILNAQLGRIEREVSQFADVIDTWDVINEAVIMPIYAKYDNGVTRICKELGRIELIRRLFETARAANPNATLLINDFDVSPAYDILVEGCLAAGIQIDVIGIQSHMHQGYWGVEKTQKVLERFERFNLPIHFTENSFLSGHLVPPEYDDLQDYRDDDWQSTPEGEARQVEEVLTHYKTLLAHPLVEVITWWDITDGAWLNAPSGLLRRDLSPKPAYEALLNLIKGEWWLSPTRMIADERGQVAFTGFLGDYELKLGDKTIPFALNDAGEAVVTVTL